MKDLWWILTGFNLVCLFVTIRLYARTRLMQRVWRDKEN